MTLANYLLLSPSPSVTFTQPISTVVCFMLLPHTEDVTEISFPTLITVSDGDDGGHWLRKPSFHYISHIQDEATTMGSCARSIYAAGRTRNVSPKRDRRYVVPIKNFDPTMILICPKYQQNLFHGSFDYALKTFFHTYLCIW